MKTKLTFILVLLLILMAAACAGPKLAPTPEPVSALQTDAVKATPTPEQTVEPTPTQTPEPTPEPTPERTLEPFGAEIWAEIRANGFTDIDMEQIIGLRAALYAEYSEDEISDLVNEVGGTSADDYILHLYYAGYRELHAEPEPTKSIDDMSLYERAYYYATPEQRERLENIKKPTGDYGDYIRQIGIITGKLAEDTPRLTLEQAREICADAIALNKTDDDAIIYVANRFAKICGAPDFDDKSGSSLSSRFLFYLDDDAAEYISVCDGPCTIFYVNEAAGINEQLLP